MVEFILHLNWMQANVTRKRAKLTVLPGKLRINNWDES